MQTIEEIKNRICLNAAWKDNVPYGYQLGLPMVSFECDELCVSFLAYKMRMQTSQILELHAPFYYIKAIYPFEKIVNLQNLDFSPWLTRNDTFYSVSFTDECVKAYNAQITKFEDIIAEWSLNTGLPDIDEYRKSLEKVLKIMTIQELYAGIL